MRAITTRTQQLFPFISERNRAASIYGINVAKRNTHGLHLGCSLPPATAAHAIERVLFTTTAPALLFYTARKLQ
jgi:hypothetical protein